MTRPPRLAATAAGLMAITTAMAPLGGCQSTLYDWGSYEASVGALSAPQGATADPQREAARIIKEIRKTERRKRLVPPGKYAHAGYLCYLTGDHAAARTFLEAEKRAFPESARFVDFMLARLEAP